MIFTFPGPLSIARLQRSHVVTGGGVGTTGGGREGGGAIGIPAGARGAGTGCLSSLARSSELIMRVPEVAGRRALEPDSSWLPFDEFDELDELEALDEPAGLDEAPARSA